MSFITCDSPGGTVLPLIRYRGATVARNACMDLEVGQRGFFILKYSFNFSFLFHLIKFSFNFYLSLQLIKNSCSLANRTSRLFLSSNKINNFNLTNFFGFENSSFRNCIHPFQTIKMKCQGKKSDKH